MPATIIQRFDHAFKFSIDDPTIENRYIIFGTEDEEEVADAISSTVPTQIGNKFLQEVPIEHVGGGVWEANARYGLRDITRQETQPEDEANAGTYSFDTGGGTQHIQYSLATTRYPGTAPESHLLIGVQKDRVEGVDIISPIYNWTEGRVMPAETITPAYKLTLAGLTGTVNSGSFRGTAAGEVLFKGASGRQDKEDKVEISYAFAYSPNQTGITIGSGGSAISGIAKKGWEYLEVRYADDVDATANRLIKKPIGVYVHQVYRLTNFGALKIGT